MDHYSVPCQARDVQKFSLFVVSCLLVGCFIPAPEPPTDQEVVELAVDAWANRYGMSGACEQVARAQIDYTDPGGCRDGDACAFPLENKIWLVRELRTDGTRIWLLVHETAHLMLACSGMDKSGDASHEHAVWDEWVDQTAEMLEN